MALRLTAIYTLLISECTQIQHEVFQSKNYLKRGHFLPGIQGLVLSDLICLWLRKKKSKLGVMMHVCNLSAQEAKAGG
jgi:hypothetical protein